MTSAQLSPELMTLIAERFKALGEPARLRILNALRHGERTVTELAVEARLGQANVSKHLHTLYSVGLVVRRRVGSFVHYAIADERLFRLCDLMCDQLEADADSRHRVVA
ncbi:MAG: ArsR/SmtB family transcription factor [Gemmatimonadaceae bacterium]